MSYEEKTMNTTNAIPQDRRSIDFRSPGTAEMCRRELQENLESLYQKRMSLEADNEQRVAEYQAIYRDLTDRIRMVEAAATSWDAEYADVPVPAQAQASPFPSR